MPSFEIDKLKPVTYRGFLDTDAQRQAIFDSVRDGYRQKAVEDDDWRLEFADVDYRQPKKYTRRDEKDAVMGRRRLYQALQGRLRFVDKHTGKVVAEDAKPRTLAHVPHMTQMGLFVHNGSQYLLANQQRLKPGVYARRKDSGDLESQFNVLPGTGRGFRLHMDHKTGLFRFNVGQSNIKLYPLLKDLGVTDKQMQQAWGKELWQANKLADDKEDSRVSSRKVLDKIGRFTDKEARTQEEVRQSINNVFKRMQLDPEVMRRTLGQPVKNVSTEAILMATNKLLRLNRGDPGVEEDSREALPYQSFHSAEDFFREHIDKDAGRLQQAAFNKLRYHKDLSKIPNNYFSKQLASVLLSSGLAAPLQQINPQEVLDQRYKVLRLGEGGIGSLEAVTKDARNIHPSHFGFIDPIRSPESAKIGLDMRLAQGTLKGSDGRLYQSVVNPHTGGRKVLSVEDFTDSVVAFPGEWDQTYEDGTPTRKVRAMAGGRVRYVPRKDVQFALPDPSNMFTPGTNFVSHISGAKGQRALMGARMQSQALSLRKPEAPLVQTAGAGGGSLQRQFASDMGAVFSKQPGVVSKITDDEIVVRHADGTKTRHDLYNFMPLNQKTMINNTPVVKRGQRIEPGQLLAKSNYTDDKGDMAIGVNALVGYHMMEGMTHEDAIVVSESAAKKFSSEQMYKKVVERGDDVAKIGKAAYDAKFPNRFDKRQLEQVDDNGVVRVGTLVQPGDPLILALGEQGKKVGGSLMKGAKSQFVDSAETWEHSAPGVVTDIDKTGKGWNVSVVSHTPLKEGDKLAGGYGNKGIVARVVPDEDMPLTPAGEPLEMVLNPMGISSRTNPAQIIEASLGKVARLTGKPYVLPGFRRDALSEFAWKELKKHGLSDTEDLTDPNTGRVIPQVFTGVQYFHKLHHLAEGKLGARSTTGYTMEGLPARGGKEGSKRLDTLGAFSLLSSGATEIIRDAKLNRGQRNDDYWKLYRLGMRPPDPRKSQAYDKFESSLQAAGVRLRKKGTKTQVLPMTQADVEDMTGDRQITVADTVDFNTMDNVKGGLFDVGLTGGQNGRKWSYIGLSEPLPNPIMETPIKLMLGLGQKDYEAVLGGQKQLGELTGGLAIKQALKRLNIDKEIDAAKDYLRSGRKTNRDKAAKKIGVLTMLKRNGLRPEEMVLDRVPVLPPAFRPVAKMEGIQLVSDANYLYKELMEANKNVDMYRSEFGRPSETVVDLYKSFKAVMGLGDPVAKETQDRGVRGILRQVLGSPPKHGQYQRKVLSTGTDLVGRGVLAPDPDLDVDEIGMPVDMAWESFKPFVIRRLVRDGMKATEAFKEWKTRGPRATKQLTKEMEARPVIVNRAPSLHKFNMTAHFAHPVAGDAIKLPIPILSGHGADFDGDSGRIYTCILLKNDIVWETHEGVTMPFHASTKVASTYVIPIQEMPVVADSGVQKSQTVVEYDVPEGVMVYAYGRDNGEHGWHPVTKFSVHQNLSMRLVKIGRRYKTSKLVSDDHSLICFTDSGEILPVKPDEAVGLMVPRAKRMSGNSVQESVEAVIHKLPTGRGRKGKAEKHQIYLNYETGFFLGALSGDGWISSDYGFFLAGRCKSTLNRWVDAAIDFTPCTSKKRILEYVAPSLGGKDTLRRRITAQNRAFARWLKPQLGDGSSNKRIPTFCFNASDSHLMGVLDGLMSTDGSVSVNRSRKKPQLLISFTSNSWDLANGVQFLGRRLGFQATVSRSRKTKNGQSFIVTFSTPDFAAFCVRTGFRLTDEKKQAILGEMLPAISAKSCCAASSDLVPYPRHLDELARELAIGALSADVSESVSGGKLRTAVQKIGSEMAAVRKAGCWSRDKALKVFANATDPAAAKYRKIIEDRDIGWVQITDVEDAGVDIGYDITVPGPLTFACADGIVVQDTANVHVLSSDKAVAEAKSKLLPSRMLLSPKTWEAQMTPNQGFVTGLYLGTAEPSSKMPRSFPSKKAVIAAYKRGEIDIDDPIVIDG